MPHSDVNAIRREIDSVAWRTQTMRQGLVAKDSPPDADAYTRERTRKLDVPSALDLMDDRLVQELAGRSDLATMHNGCWVPSSSIAQTTSLPPVESMKTEYTSLDAAVARIAQLEKMLRVQELELRRREEESTEHEEQARRLHAQNLAMHDFLSDYGMKWVGNESRGVSRASSRAPSRGASRPASGTRSSRSSSLPPDACPAAVPSMDEVRLAVLELNEIAGGGNRVVRLPDGSHGLQAPVLPLLFWKDGLQVDAGPLRAYGAPDCAAFMRDLLDGFFPYELKHAFPDGVPFGVTDRTERRHSEGEPREWGCGRVLDSRGDSRVVHLGAVEAQGHVWGGTTAAAAGAPPASMGVAALDGSSEREARAAALARAAEARLAGVAGSRA